MQNIWGIKLDSHPRWLDEIVKIFTSNVISIFDFILNTLWMFLEIGTIAAMDNFLGTRMFQIPHVRTIQSDSLPHNHSKASVVTLLRNNDLQHSTTFIKWYAITTSFHLNSGGLASQSQRSALFSHWSKIRGTSHSAIEDAHRVTISLCVILENIRWHNTGGLSWKIEIPHVEIMYC